MSTLNVAIIGANGFIGSNLTRLLLDKPNIHLKLFGRSTQSIIQGTSIYQQIDLLNSKRNEVFFKDVDVIYYLASETIPANSWDNPLVDIEKNLKPFLTFAECVSKLSIKKIIYLSSAGTVYGTNVEKVDENFNKNPFSPYGITKLAIENFLLYYKIKHGINYDIFRVSNVYGEGQDTSKGLGIINTFLERIINNQKITIFGDGNNLRNYIYVKDVAELLTLNLTNNINTSAIYNLSSDDSLTVNQIIESIKQVVSEKFNVIFEKQRQSDNTAIDLDNTKLKKAVPGFKFTPIIQGIEQTYNFIKSKQSI